MQAVLPDKGGGFGQERGINNGGRQYDKLCRTTHLEGLRRNGSRREAVPEAAVRRMLGALEPPGHHETQEVQWVCV